MSDYRRDLTLTLGTILTFSFASAMTVVLLPIRVNDLQIATSLFGLLIALPAAITLAFEIPLAAFSDRIGRKPIMSLGIGLGIIGSLLLAWRADTTFLFIFSVINSFASVFYFPSALAYLSEASRIDDHANVQGVNGFIQGIAFAAGALMAGKLVSWFSFQTAMMVVVVILIICLLISFIIREVHEKSDVPKSSIIKEILRTYQSVIKLITERRTIQLAAQIESVYSILIAVLGNSFFPLFITGSGLNAAGFAGGLLGVRNLSSAGVSLFYGKATKKYGEVVPLFSMLALTAITFLVMPENDNAIFWYALMVIQGIGVGFIPAAPNVLIAEGANKDERALGYAVVAFISRVLQMIFPILFGFLADFTSFRVVFITGGLLALIVIGLSLINFHRNPLIDSALAT